MFGKKKSSVASVAVDKENIINNMADKNKERVEKEILIHTLPEKFLSGSDSASKAKKIGIIILLISGLFLIALIVLLYIYLFKPSSVSNVVEVNNIVQEVETVDKENNKEVVVPEKKNDNLITEDPTTSTSSEEIINTEIATSTIKNEIAISTPVKNEVLVDSDNDGLNNVEEDILGTNKNELDSDGDNYSDYEEVMNLYNPAGSGKLVDNSGIEEYINTTYNYSVLYPSNWKMNILGSDDSIVFKSQDNQIFQIYIQPNSSLENIEKWYEEQIGIKPNKKNEIINDKWKGVISDDGMTVYLTDNDYNFVYTLLYIPEFEADNGYKNLFQMMINSFKIEEL